MNRNRIALASLLAVGAIALSLGLWWRSAAQAPAPSAVGATELPAETTDPISVSADGDAESPAVQASVQRPALAPIGHTPAPGAAEAPPSVPLPALDAPLAETLAELRRRADAGDARAACRVAAELRKCELVDVQLAMAQRMEANRARIEQGNGGRGGRGGNDYLQFIEQQYQQTLAASEHCASVPPSTPSEQIHYWRQAALAGHLPSMTMYATGNVFRLRNSLASLAELEVYRHEAETLARRAALAGDAEALLALTQAYTPQEDNLYSSLLSQATGTDIVEELSMLLLAQNRGLQPGHEPGRDRRGNEAVTIDALIADARARADSAQILRAERLASERAAAASPIQGTTTGTGRRDRGRGFMDDERQRCESEAFAPVAATAASG